MSVIANADTGRPNPELGPRPVQVAIFLLDLDAIDNTGTKISIAITAMLTLIAYRFAIGASLPQISYLTRMDLFILFSTILIYASLVMVVATAAFSAKGKPEVAERIDGVARWGLPLAFIASWVVSMMMPN